MADFLEQLSDSLADRLATVAGSVVAIRIGHRDYSGILWRDDVVVTSEQVLPQGTDFTIAHAGAEHPATLAGRDPGTNVAVLRLFRPLEGKVLAVESSPRAGSLTLIVGADSHGNPTGRLGMLHAVGPAWHSEARGRIDALLRLDTRLGADEGGPVLTLTGRLIGMSTSGPRRRALAIPTSTIERVLEPLLTEGRIARGWLGVALQQVRVPERMRDAAGRDAGMMVIGLASGSPAEQAGILPGDIVLEADGKRTGRARGLVSFLTPESIGQPVTLKLLRAGDIRLVTIIVGAQPAKP